VVRGVWLVMGRGEKKTKKLIKSRK
jgi:hypothetical protein